MYQSTLPTIYNLVKGSIFDSKRTLGRWLPIRTVGRRLHTQILHYTPLVSTSTDEPKQKSCGTTITVENSRSSTMTLHLLLYFRGYLWYGWPVAMAFFWWRPEHNFETHQSTRVPDSQYYLTCSNRGSRVLTIAPSWLLCNGFGSKKALVHFYSTLGEFWGKRIWSADCTLRSCGSETVVSLQATARPEIWKIVI